MHAIPALLVVMYFCAIIECKNIFPMESVEHFLSLNMAILAQNNSPAPQPLQPVLARHHPIPALVPHALRWFPCSHTPFLLWAPPTPTPTPTPPSSKKIICIHVQQASGESKLTSLSLQPQKWVAPSQMTAFLISLLYIHR
jgi:hypothetical protein